MPEKIVHEGIVTGIEPNVVTVKIQSSSACGSCHAKSMCQMSEKTDKDVVVKTKRFSDYAIGEKVDVYLMSGMGLRAVLYAYVFSLVAAALGFIVASFFTTNQGIWGLCALVTLAIYFLILKWRSEILNARFYFGIEKKTGPGEFSAL